MTEAKGCGDLPLRGLRVLDFTRLLPGPLCTMLLGDYGAQIIKIEEIQAGEPIRFIGSSFKDSDAPGGFLFRQLNRNKQSLALDLKKKQGRDIIRQLAARADIVVEGFRPGVMDRLGLGYEKLSAVNGRLIYAAISGYGRDSSYRQRAGHDINYMALSGLLDLNSEKGGPPQLPAFQVADIAGGALMALSGIMIALYEREMSGEGRLVDISMTRGLLPWLTYPASYLNRGSELPRRGRGLLSGTYACYNAYETADGKYMSLGALEPVFWTRFCRAVGKPQWIKRQFDRQSDEAVGNRALIGEVQALFKSRTRNEWVEFLAGKDACCEPVLDLHEAIDHPLHREEGYWLDLPAGEGKGEKTPGFPILFSGWGGQIRLPPPRHGEHTKEILLALGYDQEDLEDLKERRVVKCAD